MNILYLTNIFSDKVGGSEYVFWLYAKYMARNGHNVHVICYSLDEESLSRLEGAQSKINVIELVPEARHRGVLFQSSSINAKYLKKGLQEIKTLCRDVDVIHSNTYIPALLGGVARKLLGKPHLLTIHDIGSIMGLQFLCRWFREGGNNTLVSYIKALAGIAYEHIIVNCIPKDAILVPSSQTRNDVDIISRNNKGDMKVHVVPHFIDTGIYEQYKQQYKVKHEPCILYIGRLVFYKNVHTLVKAFREVLHYSREAKLVIIGKGPLEPLLKNYIHKHDLENNIIMLGAVGQEEKLKWLSRCLTTVNLSVFEGFGMVILESWYFEKPVIVSNMPPMNELVENGVNGYTVNPVKQEEIKELMLNLIEDQDLARKLGTRGFNKVSTRFTPEAIVKQLELIYDDLINA